MSPVRPSRRAGLSALACAVALASPAAAQTAAHNPDPFEKWNRKVFAFNQALYKHVLRPAAMLWEHAAPALLRTGLRNAYSNLGEPVVMINDAIQARPRDAARSFGRFAFNSTLGVAGLFDFASRHGLPHHDNGFGTTLGRWGAGPGPYFYLPVLGPSDVRDGIGSGVDVLMNPQTWIAYGARPAAGTAEGISGGLNTFADADGQLQTIYATATDPYATIRSLYLQNRAAQIRGETVDVNALPDFDDPNDLAPASPHAGVTPAAPGAVSPTGAPPLKTSGIGGDAAALPQAGIPGPSPSSDAPPPGAATPQPHD